MPLNFDFNSVVGSGSSSSIGTNPLAYTEDGITFTPSANGTGNWYVTYNNEPADGQYEIEASTATAGNITVVMTFTDGFGNSQMVGTLNLDVFGSGIFHWLTTGGTGGGAVLGVDGADFMATGGTRVTGIRFTLSQGQTIQLDTLTSTADGLVCYMPGTAIATPAGPVAVEDLAEGDRVLLADGGESRVVWIGRQQVAPRFTDPLKVNPICITAGAIAEGVPSRNLYVSPDHAVAIDGMLYNASALVNGRSIYQVAKMPLDGFTYYHVETEGHELLLAEGCPAESYLDIPDRSVFTNGAERADAPMIPEMDLPRIVSARLLPAAVRARLDARAEKRAPRRAA